MTMKLVPALSRTINNKHLTFNLKSIVSCQLSVVRKTAGFTLIELLVAVAILGILAAAATASYNSAQERARDSKRKSNLAEIKKALELSRQDTAAAYYFPNSLTPLSPTYIRTVPTDPKTGASFIYDATPNSPDCTTTSTCTSYTLTACIENANDSSKDATKNSGCTLTSASYTITPDY